MKFGKIFIAILLVLCMMLSMCACSGSDDKKDDKESKKSNEKVENKKDDEDDENDDKDSKKEAKDDEDENEDENEDEDRTEDEEVRNDDDGIEGAWELEINYGAILANTYISEMGIEFEEDPDFDLPLCSVWEFDEDGNFALSFDKDQTEEAIDEFFDDFSSLVAQTLYNIWEEQGVSDEEIEEKIEEECGGDFEGWICDEMASMYDPAELLEELPELEGTYELDGEELTMTIDGEDLVVTIEIDGDELSVIDADLGLDDEDVEMLDEVGLELPLVLNRK